MDKKKILMIAGGVLIVLIVLLIIVSLFGGDEETPGNRNPGTGNPPTSNASATIEYWGLWESEEVMRPLIDEYKTLKPNVTIVYTQRSFTQYEENLITRLQQGSTAGNPAPDIFRMHNSWLPRFQPYLSPLPSNVMDSTQYSQTFYPTAANDLTGTDGNIYGVPLEIDGLALFYNKEIFTAEGISAPPENWDELIEIAKDLTVKDSSGQITRPGAAIGTSSNISHSADILSLLMLQNGAEINQNSNTEVDLTSDRAVSALQFYTDFALIHEVWSADLGNDLEMFYSGELPIMFAPSWRAFDIINANPNIEFGIAPTPKLGEFELYYASYWAEAVYGTSQNQAEAWEFIKFLSASEQMQKFYSNSVQIGGRAFGEPYGRVDLGSQIANDAYAGAIITMAPNMAAWKMADQQFTEEVLRIAINDVAVEGGDPGPAMTDAQESINAKLLQLVVQ